MQFPFPTKPSKKSLNQGCRSNYGFYLEQWYTALSLQQVFNVVSLNLGAKCSLRYSNHTITYSTVSLFCF